jgi:hypothetical protein
MGRVPKSPVCGRWLGSRDVSSFTETRCPRGPCIRGPGMPQTSTRNPFTMLPITPLKSPSVYRPAGGWSQSQWFVSTKMRVPSVPRFWGPKTPSAILPSDPVHKKAHLLHIAMQPRALTRKIGREKHLQPGKPGGKQYSPFLRYFFLSLFSLPCYNPIEIPSR